MQRRDWLTVLALAGCLWGAVSCGGDDHTASVAPPRFQRPQEPPRQSRPAVTLSGRLTDRVTSHPLAGAIVLVQHSERPRVLARSTAAADGTFTLSGLPLGRPLRVVSQPVTGALAYGTEVSQPITLAEGRTAPAVNLACVQVAHPGSIEVARATHAPGPTEVALVLRKDAGGGHLLKLVVRTGTTSADGAIRFAAVPPGTYEIHFLTRGGPPRPRPAPGSPRGPHRRRPSVEVTVQASTITHAQWPARLQAVGEVPDEVQDVAAEGH